MDEMERQLNRMSVGDILDYSIAVYKRNFKKLTLLSLIFFVPFIVVYTIATSYLSAEFQDIVGIGPLSGNPSELTYTLMAYYLVLIVVGLVYFAYSITLQPIMESAVIRIVYADVLYGREYDFKGAIKESFKSFPRLMANKFLYGLIVFAVALGVYILFFIIILLAVFSTSSFYMGSIVSQGNPLENTAMLISLGILSLILLLGMVLLIAFFALKFGFSLNAVVLENKGAVEGLSRSWRLSKNKFWHIFFSSILGGILLFAVPTLLSAAVSLLLPVDRTLYTVLTVVTEVLSSLIYPYLTVLFTMLFISLKIQKEGLDLEVKVDKLLEAQKTEEQELQERRPGDYGA